MATVDKVFQASSAAALQTIVNDYLATLVNPTIRVWQLQASDVPRYLGTEYRFLLTTTTGGAALATPFLLDLLSYQSSVTLEPAIAAYRVTYAGQFISGAKFNFVPSDNVVASALVAAFIRNVTAGATANYVITP